MNIHCDCWKVSDFSVCDECIMAEKVTDTPPSEAR